MNAPSWMEDFGLNGFQNPVSSSSAPEELPAGNQGGRETMSARVCLSGRLAGHCTEPTRVGAGCRRVPKQTTSCAFSDGCVTAPRTVPSMRPSSASCAEFVGEVHHALGRIVDGNFGARFASVGTVFVRARDMGGVQADGGCR